MWPTPSSTTAAGAQARFLVLLKDMYNNTVNTYTGGFNTSYQLSASVLANPGDLVELPGYNITLADDADVGYKIVKFYPKVAGNYWLAAWSLADNLTGSPFPFTVTAGSISVWNCTASWLNGVNSFDAGTQAVIQIFLMDAYGNNVSIATGRNDSYNFAVEVLGFPDAIAAWNVSLIPQNFSGFQSVVFYPTNAGTFSLRVGSKSKNITGSPFNLTVNPGPLSVPDSAGEWLDDVQFFLQNTTVSMVIYPKDIYGNSIPSAGITEANFSSLIYSATNLSLLQVPDVTLTPQDNTSLLMSFNFTMVGKFIIQVGNISEDIHGSPFIFTIISDVVDPTRTILDGDGLKNSTAGVLSQFLVELRDSNGLPATGNISGLTVDFLRAGLPVNLTTNISTVTRSNGAFLVSYTAQVAGNYRIIVKWEGIVLGGGPSIKKTVFPANIIGQWCNVVSSAGLNGRVGISSSVQVATVDMYNNSAPTGPVNISVSFFPPAFETKSIINNRNGTYTIKFNITKAGSYSMMIQAGSVNATDPINGSPFMVDILPGPISVSSSRGSFDDGSDISQGRPGRYYVYMRDRYKNRVFRTFDPVLLDMFKAQIYNSDGLVNVTTLTVQQFRTVDLVSDQILISFTMNTLGDYRLVVGNDTSRIQNGAPIYFSIVADAPSLRKCVFMGSGIKDSVAGDNTTIIVMLMNQFGFLIDSDPALIFINMTMLTDDSRSMIVRDVQALGDGMYEANYTATFAGDYTVYITWDDTLLATYNKTVKPGPVIPNMCVASGPGLLGGVAGDILDFNITSFDAYGNPSSSSSVNFIILFDPDLEGNSELWASRYGLGHFQGNYSIGTARSYNMTLEAITAESQSLIRGSPFPIKIKPGKAERNSAIVTGEGLSMLASVQKWNKVTVWMTDIYDNPAPITLTALSFSIQGPGPCNYLPFSLKPRYKYSALYKPSVVGLYQIKVMYNGTDLAGSPFNVTVGTEVVTAKDFRATIMPSTKVPAGEFVTISISASYNTSLNLFFVIDLISDFSIETLFPEHAPNGSYTVVSNMTVAGSYIPYILLFGSSIAGSYSLEVVPGAISVPRCMVSDKMNLESVAVVGVPKTVVVQGKDRFDNVALTDLDEDGNSVNFTMILSGLTMQEFPLVYSSNGRYIGTFIADSDGPHDLIIMSDHTEILNSPFLIFATQ